jgi:UDP-N-acetylglucosamine 4,6-dehydratase (inverting)
MFASKTLLLTGGTGFFGQSFLNYCIKNKIKFKKIIIFSRDEFKQYEMQKIYDPAKYKFLRYFLGDVRDIDRLKVALRGVDFVLHAAALKHVPAAEYNPTEYIKTNIIGSQNLVEAGMHNKVKKIIALSTDKAASPLNLYGATKLCLEKLFTSSNNYVGNQKISFSCIRYGNVLGSRGSVLPLFLEQEKKNFFTITDSRMTRFNIMIEECIKIVFFAFKKSIGGEIFIPKVSSINIVDLAKAVNPNKKIRYTGIRPGEKLHEELITPVESLNTYCFGKYYVITTNKKLTKKLKKAQIKFGYNSKENTFLSVSQIKKIISKLK